LQLFVGSLIVITQLYQPTGKSRGETGSDKGICRIK